MGVKYSVPVCIRCKGRLDLESFSDKIVCHINKNGVVDFERQGQNNPGLKCTSCGETYEYYFDNDDRIHLDLEVY